MTEKKDIFEENATEKPSDFQKVAKSYRSGWRYAEYAFQYGAAIVLCTLAGYWLDKWLNTGYIFLIIGVVFGSVGGFINLYFGVTRKRPQNNKDKTE